ncbi:Gfo/Idh/MocA family protein [Falsihalocynthiibacter sp. SS001]|uniref:Gfo/Idh/MocA family protein n=1 Tax=Falsihalocynthiibacter sp. SS001 TaxID=3349698 RepID=UPI0036D259A2
MTQKLGIGIIGAGNISAAYLRLAPMFKGIEMRAVADLNMDAANARAEEFGVRAETVEGLLASDDIDIVVNLTIPAAHFEVSKNILNAGKHVYSEKPFVLTLQEGAEIAALASEKGLRVGSAPDTFMGGAHQRVRDLIDTGTVGDITSGTAFVMGHGMEHWHPNPDFFYQPGAGPVLDIGPYYVTNLVQLLGPVARVAALTATPAKERLITSEPRNGEKIPVDTPTTIHALLEFQSGAVITMVTSWDVWQHEHSNMELYGQEGSIHVPDPNFFGGDIRLTKRSDFVDLPGTWDHPLEVPNDGENANYRAAGLSDMALAIGEGRPHRCSSELALHAVEVMTSILAAGDARQFVEMTTTCERPAPLGPDEARALLA